MSLPLPAAIARNRLRFAQSSMTLRPLNPRSATLSTSSHQFTAGEPWPNGRKFFKYLTNDDTSSKFEGVKYSVFGCGLNVFLDTYQYVPRTIDDRMSALGGVRLHERGVGEASRTVHDEFDRWKRAFFEVVRQVWASC